MLRISKLADYGTLVMVCLARQPDVLISARDLARQTHLTLPTVSKLLKKLTQAKLLISERGVSGGYRLKHKAHEISVASIIYALDEQRGLTECSVHSNRCSLAHVCHVQGNWQLISHAIEAALESVTLEALAKPVMVASDVIKISQLVREVSRGEQ